MFCMFYNYSHLFPKIKCLSEKNTVYIQILSHQCHECPIFVDHINKHANILYTKQKTPIFIQKRELLFIIM
jgi:hypothetical protein